MITMLKSAALLAVVAAAAATAAPVVTADGVPMVRVSYADLDLAKPAGVAEFNRRITHAVTAICPPDGIALDRQIAVKRCRTAALKSASAEREQVFAALASRTVQLASR